MHKRTCLQWTLTMALGALAGPAVRAAGTPAALHGVKTVAAEDVKKLLDSGVPVIDTRVSAEHAQKTIKGAVSVPYQELSAKNVDFDPSMDEFDLARLPANKHAPLVFFCNAGEGWKSYKAAVVAKSSGYSQVHWFRGGLPEWRSKGLPTR